MKYFLAIIVLLFIGCGSPDIPEWYTNHPQDNAKYIYSASEGMSKEDALNNALSLAASRVSVTVNSTFSTSKEYVQTDDKFSNFRQLSRQTTSKINNISFSDYSVLKMSHDDDSNKYYVLIRVDKVKNAKLYYSKAKSTVEEVKGALNVTDRVTVFKTYPKLIKKINKAIYNLYIVKSLYPVEGVDELIKEAEDIKKELVKKYSSISMRIVTRYRELKKILSQVFSQLNIPLSSKGIRVSGKIHTTHKRVGMYYITIKDVNVIFRDKTYFQLNVTCGGKSVDSYTTADSFARKRCVEKIKTAIEKLAD